MKRQLLKLAVDISHKAYLYLVTLYKEKYPKEYQAESRAESDEFWNKRNKREEEKVNLHKEVSKGLASVINKGQQS